MAAFVTAAHAPSPPTLTDMPTDPGLPTHIGRYEVRARLGAGATSEVFLAHDPFHDRPVAIKRVRPAMLFGELAEGNGSGNGNGSGPEGRYYERFFAAEAALVGRLQHPNVVQIYDAVADPQAPYLVMEVVQGVTLRRYCRADALLPLDQIVEIGFKCAMALGYVARQGLIHRDVKPANILAVVDGELVVDVKITDFGSVLNLASDHTQIFRVGSLAYMSPEQLDGSTLDARADIYSLAAVLYHLVAGRPPFDAESQTALMNQIYHLEPPPLSGLRKSVPPRLEALIRQALAKDPAERPAGWDEFAQALSALVADRAVPRGRIQAVMDSERFNLLRTLDFFSGFDDVALWEVVHRAKWQRFKAGHALYKRGQEGNTFHIIAQGQVEVFRDRSKVAQLGAGTSVGEMAYLAPSPELKRHSTDVTVSQPCTTISFVPDTLQRLSPHTRHLFDAAFIRVLVRRLHAAHEALAHPRRIL